MTGFCVCWKLSVFENLFKPEYCNKEDVEEGFPQVDSLVIILTGGRGPGRVIGTGDPAHHPMTESLVSMTESLVPMTESLEPMTESLVYMTGHIHLL